MPYSSEKYNRDKEKLRTIRERFKYCLECWKDIRDQHDIDMRFRAGDQWDDREKRKRDDQMYPMIVVDETTQYVNQLVNDVRENKRGVKIEPEGYGANEKTADLLEGWVRGIEYKSNAQAAYISGFEGAVVGSYGFWKLQTYFENDKSFNQSVKIVQIPNGNTVVFDPDCLNYDCSDAADCFEVNFISHDEFKRRHPKAEILEFTDEIRQIAPEWVKDKQVQIASYWKVQIKKVKLHLVDPKDGRDPIVMREDELPEGIDRALILKSRDCEERRVIQTILNGVEILEVNDPKDKDNPKGWPGQWIPIIPCWGQEVFVDEGAGSKRKLMSLIRLARDPQQWLNYCAAQEIAEAKMTPKTPYMGPKGMFSNQMRQWETINDVPAAYVEFEIPEGSPPGTAPIRVPFAPNFQQYEIVKESAKRSIQAAMGISPLPTAAQRANEKSGVALERIQGERQKGSYHFIDNFERSLEFTGRQLAGLFDILHDTARDVAIRDKKNQQKVVRVNDPSSPKNQPFDGEHSVTVSSGPSYQSARQMAESFVDTLIGAVPGVFPLIGDLLVKLRLHGDPIGDEIAQRLTPPQFAQQDGQEPLPPHAIQAIQKTQQELQQMHAYAQKLEQVVAQLQNEKAAKMVELDGKLQIEKIHSDTQKAVAEINTKAQNINERIKALEDLVTDFHQMAHERALSSQEHQQALEQGQQQAALQPPQEPNANGQ